MHVLTRFRHQPFNAQKVSNAFAGLINDTTGKYIFLVAVDANHHLVGALIGVIEQQIFTDAFTASIMHFDVFPEARMGGHAVKLIKAFEQWAKNRGVVEICFGINSGVETGLVSRFAQKIGYRIVGENLVKLCSQ